MPPFPAILLIFCLALTVNCQSTPTNPAGARVVLLNQPNQFHPNITHNQDILNEALSLKANVANIVEVFVGVYADMKSVKLNMKDVRSTAVFALQLDNVKAILNDTMNLIDENSELIENILQEMNSTIEIADLEPEIVGQVGTRIYDLTNRRI